MLNNLIKNIVYVPQMCLMLLIILTSIGCSSKSIVVIEGPTELLKEPYPIGYPSTNPHPNEIVSVLKKGDVGEVLSYDYGKDYKYYKVKMNDGKIGYLIFGDNFKILQQEK